MRILRALFEKEEALSMGRNLCNLSQGCQVTGKGPQSGFRVLSHSAGLLVSKTVCP